MTTKRKQNNPKRPDGFEKMDKAKHIEVSRKGAYAAAKKRQENKTFKQALTWALELPAFNNEDELIGVLQEKFGITITNREAMSIALVKQALSGDVKAYQVARDTTGELPEQTVNVKNDAPMVITVETIGEEINHG